MPIADELAAVIRKAHHLPELIPFLEATNLAAGDNTIISLSEPTVSLGIPVLTDRFSAIPNVNVLVKLKADREATHEMETLSLDVMGELTPLEFLSTRSLSLVLNSDAIVNNYRMYLGLWVVKPSVAQRLLWGLPLSAEEKTLSTKRGVEESVTKGVLPFPISYQIERECMGFKRTYSEIVANVTAGQITPILSIAPPLDEEVLVLESVTADNAGLALADNAQLYITRDDDTNYLKLPCFAMDQAYDFPCFIPALSKLQIGYYAGVNLVNRQVRVVIGQYKLTDLLRARFGLATPEETRESVLAGVVP
jgi:hypothetical protein